MDVTISERFVRTFISAIALSLSVMGVNQQVLGDSSVVFVTDDTTKELAQKTPLLAEGAVRFTQPSQTSAKQVVRSVNTQPARRLPKAQVTRSQHVPAPITPVTQALATRPIESKQTQPAQPTTPPPTVQPVQLAAAQVVPPLAIPDSPKQRTEIPLGVNPFAASLKTKVAQVSKVQSAPLPLAKAKKAVAPQPQAPVSSSPITLMQHVEPLQPLSVAKPPMPVQTAPMPVQTAEYVETKEEEPQVETQEPIQPFQRVIHQKVQQVSHQTPQRKAAKMDPVSRILIEAHDLSQRAQTEADYSAIAEKCREALAEGASEEKKHFARHLTSWSLNRRGQLRLRSEKKLAANADFQTAIDFDPSNWRALHNRAVSRAELGQLADAFDDFNRVIKLNPDYAKAYANRATLFMQANDIHSALEDYQQAALVDPRLIAAEMGQGRVCHMLGRLEEAVQHFTKAAQIDPTNADVICSRGDLLADMGRYAEAMADYARTIEIDPNYGHAYRNGAWLLATCPQQQFRDPENAVLGARQALQIGYGEKHIALDTLAAALASAGEYEEAIATLNTAIEQAPEELKFPYLTRLQLYQDRQPYRTEPLSGVSQAAFEVSDRQ